MPASSETNRALCERAWKRIKKGEAPMKVLKALKLSSPSYYSWRKVYHPEAVVGRPKIGKRRVGRPKKSEAATSLAETLEETFWSNPPVHSLNGEEKDGIIFQLQMDKERLKRALMTLLGD